MTARLGRWLNSLEALEQRIARTPSRTTLWPSDPRHRSGAGGHRPAAAARRNLPYRA